MNTMNVLVRMLLLSAIVTLSACSNEPQTADGQSLSPPVAEKRQHVVRAPAGERVDPYYWMRDDKRRDPDVLGWLESENRYTQSMLEKNQDLQRVLVDEMRSRIQQDETSAPYLDDGYWYYTRYEQGLEYPIYARRKQTLEADEEILLDGNELARDRDFFQIGGWDVSPDGRRLAWLQDVVGRRQFRLLVKDIDSGEVADTGVNGISSAAWSADGTSIFYVENHPETLRSYRVRRYYPGSGADELLYEENDTAYYTSVGRTRSDRYNYIYLQSTTTTEMHVIDSARADAGFEVFLPRESGHEYAADHVGDHWIVRSNWQAPNFRIMRVDDPKHADRSHWQDVIAHDEAVFIHEFDAFERFLAVSERVDGLRRLRVLDYVSGEDRIIEFAEAAYVAQLGRNREPATKSLQFVYTSMTTPRSTWELDMLSGERRMIQQIEVPGEFDPTHYQTDRIWVEARDGARIPVSLVRHRDTPLDGTAPLYQYGYGSYGSSMEPAFSTARLSLLDRGFIFAIAHIRGGQEMGREWYEQGRLLHKMNTFTDFIDVTEDLVAQRLVDADRVFAMGGSAGGLLVGAVANLAPERYAGIVAHVPFVDVVTTMLDESIPLTTNEFDEWGNPMDPRYYEYMLRYSPYDNVRATDYPAMLVTTGLWDSQVQYWEPAKWVARLRELKTDDNPLLFHVNMDAGHGGQSGRFRRLEQTALEYAFILDQAGAG
ncbi:MAG: S9 family peptidase [Xanthomonadaceae bacterium]|nr:S9 family peptidase [Xanthomonadaceae bacterium]